MPSWICRIPFLNTNNYLHKFPIFPHISRVSFSTSTPKISLFDYLVNHHNFSPESAARLSSASSAKCIKPQNADSVVGFFKEIGFSNNQVEAVVHKAPSVLSADLETTIKPKFKVFQDLGIHSFDFAHLISASPFLLYRSADKLRLSILGLKNVLGPNADICRLLTNFGFSRILKDDLDRAFVPNIEYLKSCGVCSLKIATYVCRFPMFFLANQEKLKGLVQRVDDMGVDRKSKIFLCAVTVMSSLSMESWELKLKLFRDLGFSEQNVLNSFRTAPQAFTVSERKIKEITQLVLSVENLTISEIVKNPMLLTYSVEKRLRPRVRVFKALQSKNLLKKQPGFATFCQMADANFRNKYVIPYSNELGDIYVDSQSS